ncbi:MAG: hypothetical protein H6739_08070 [Alphaproteobacteria bacterium]|nr:hypothetical protein [Alphaproteobacteria bacterium]
MAEATQTLDLARQGVAARISGQDDVTVRRDLPVDSAADVLFDLYLAAPRPAPVAVLVSGYPDPGFQAQLGCRFKDMASVQDWARMLAASGVAAVAVSATEPVTGLAAALAHLRRRGDALGVDAERIGLWACSGNAPTALGAFLDDPAVRCAALLYGYTLDLDGGQEVAEAAGRFFFATPAAGRGVDALPADRPLLLLRAGADAMPGLNVALDRLVAAALAADRPLTVINLPAAPHAFDLMDGHPRAATAIAQVLEFLRRGLTAPRR